MSLREKGDSPFIGENDGANPTYNRRGIALFSKATRRLQSPWMDIKSSSGI